MARSKMRGVYFVGRKGDGPSPSLLRAVETSRGVKGATGGVPPGFVGKQGFRPFLPGQGPTGGAIAYQLTHGSRSIERNRSPFRY